MRWWCVWMLTAGLAAGAQAASLFDMMENNAELSEFLDLVKTDELASIVIRQTESTVFAPNNAAMRNYTGERSTNMLLYHVVNLALSVDQLKSEVSVPTRLKGNQPVFISVHQSGQVFINNARILHSDIRTSSETQQDQVMHIIDEVLEPSIPTDARHSMHFNPSALELLANSELYDLGGASIKQFYQVVQAEEQLDIFRAGSFHTYFIPIDENFVAVRHRVTTQVLRGHVIPNHALFTRTIGEGSYRTLAYNDTLKVTIKLHGENLPPVSQPDGTTGDGQTAPENLQQSRRVYEAQSTVLVDNIGDLQSGLVLSRVLKPNIAVKNGVVHLIKRPLVVSEGDVFQMIKEGRHDRFREFFKLIRTHGQNFTTELMAYPYATIFIPSNQAFNNVNQRRLQEIIASPGELHELLKLHVVTRKVTTESVRKSAQNQPYSVDSEAPSRLLYLSVTGDASSEQTLTVESGGTNATVVVPDISRDNGVIHIIDRFLGIPYQTVAERFSTDPLASVTASLASESGFTQQLKASERMTLLLPADVAWRRLKAQLPTTYKAVFNDKKSSEVLAVLTRHLVLDRALSIQQMAAITVSEGGVATSTGQTVQVEHIPGSQEYVVKWQGLQARVEREDEECTNGYIHVIDAVLIDAKDVSAPSPSAATSAAGPAALSGLLLATCWALLRL